MTLAQDILGSNADIEAGEAAYLMAGYAAGCGDPAGVLAGRDGRGAPLLDMLIDEDVLAEAPGCTGGMCPGCAGCCSARDVTARC